MPKEYREKLDNLLLMTHRKDLDRAYFAVLLRHYLDHREKYVVDDDLSRVFVSKLKNSKNLKTLDLSLDDYDYSLIKDLGEVRFSSVKQQTTFAFCSLVIHFVKMKVKSLSVSDKFQLIIKT